MPPWLWLGSYEAVRDLPQPLVQYHVLHRIGDGACCSVVHLITALDQVLLYAVKGVPQGVGLVGVSAWVQYLHDLVLLWRSVA